MPKTSQKDRLYDRMHTKADIVAEKLRKVFQPAIIDGFDCDDVLMAAKEWLDENDKDVLALDKAIQAFDRSMQ